MKLLLVALLIFPLTVSAMCEREEKLYANSINLHVKVKDLHETSKKLFEQKRLSVKEMTESFNLLKRTFDMLIKSQHLYYECQARTMV
jgi:antirestriction protein